MKKLLIDINNITIGSDPEFFIVDADQKAFPSTEIFKGTKDEPEQQGGGFAVLKDNVLVEGNIPPAHSCEEYVSFMTNLQNIINSVLEIHNLKLFASDSMEYKQTHLDHPDANVFGCSAYKNAWALGTFSAENMSHLPIRVCGDHQHIGYTLLTDEISQRIMNRYIAKAFDYFVTWPSRQHHNDEFRERYYGPYGVYRDCPAYGLECRALGGHFTHPDHLAWVYENTVKAVVFCADRDNLSLLDAVDAPVTSDREYTLQNYSILGINYNDLLIKTEEKCLDYSIQ
jgi:hypothetical protein